MRAIAEESGWSTGSLAHYFSDRDDILVSALRYSHQVIKGRWAAKLEHHTGLTALRELLLDNLPLDEERTVETKLEVMFWSQALNADGMMDVQQEEAADLYSLIHRHVMEGQEAGELNGELDPAIITARLFALIDGLSLHHVLYGGRLSREAIATVIEDELRTLQP